MGTPSRVSTVSIRNTDRTGSDVVIWDQHFFPDAQILKMATVLKYVKRVRATDAILHPIAVAYRARLGGSNPSEIPKALQNRAKLNPIVKTVRNC